MSQRADLSDREPAPQKKPYEAPRILLVEQLEAVAVDCSPNGKEAPGAPKPGGGGICGFANS